MVLEFWLAVGKRVPRPNFGYTRHCNCSIFLSSLAQRRSTVKRTRVTRRVITPWFPFLAVAQRSRLQNNFQISRLSLIRNEIPQPTQNITGVYRAAVLM